MFESQSDMLQLYFGPDLPERPTYGVPATHLDRSNIERLAVKDYTTGREIDGREAVLVYGSRVDGPMGPDVFAFTRREDAETFSGTNGGRVMTFAELTPQMVLELVKN
jgi:nitrous oxide reductase accessory protein NosL